MSLGKTRNGSTRSGSAFFSPQAWAAQKKEAIERAAKIRQDRNLGRLDDTYTFMPQTNVDQQPNEGGGVLEHVIDSNMERRMSSNAAMNDGLPRRYHSNESPIGNNRDGDTIAKQQQRENDGYSHHPHHRRQSSSTTTSSTLDDSLSSKKYVSKGVGGGGDSYHKATGNVSGVGHQYDEDDGSGGNGVVILIPKRDQEAHDLFSSTLRGDDGGMEGRMRGSNGGIAKPGWSNDSSYVPSAMEGLNGGRTAQQGTNKRRPSQESKILTPYESAGVRRSLARGGGREQRGSSSSSSSSASTSTSSWKHQYTTRPEWIDQWEGQGGGDQGVAAIVEADVGRIKGGKRVGGSSRRLVKEYKDGDQEVPLGNKPVMVDARQKLALLKAKMKSSKGSSSRTEIELKKPLYHQQEEEEQSGYIGHEDDRSIRPLGASGGSKAEPLSVYEEYEGDQPISLSGSSSASSSRSKPLGEREGRVRSAQPIGGRGGGRGASRVEYDYESYERARTTPITASSFPSNEGRGRRDVDQEEDVGIYPPSSRKQMLLESSRRLAAAGGGGGNGKGGRPLSSSSSSSSVIVGDQDEVQEGENEGIWGPPQTAVRLTAPSAAALKPPPSSSSAFAFQKRSSSPTSHASKPWHIRSRSREKGPIQHGEEQREEEQEEGMMATKTRQLPRTPPRQSQMTASSSSSFRSSTSSSSTMKHTTTGYAPHEDEEAYQGGSTATAFGDDGPSSAVNQAELFPCPICDRSFNERAFKVHQKVCKKVFSSKRKAFDSRKARVDGTEAAKYVRDLSPPPSSSKSRVMARAASLGGSSRKGSNDDLYDEDPYKKAPSSRTGLAWNKTKGGIIEQEEDYSSRQPAAQSSAQKRPVLRKANRHDEVPVGGGEGGGKGAKKWKQQSEAFRAMLKQNRMLAQAEKEGRPLASVPTMPSAPDPSFIQCPHCQRRFNEQAAERHFPKCSSIRAKCPPCQRRFNEQAAERHIPKCSSIRAKPNTLIKGGGTHLGAAARESVAAPSSVGSSARRASLSSKFKR